MNNWRWVVLNYWACSRTSSSSIVSDTESCCIYCVLIFVGHIIPVGPICGSLGLILLYGTLYVDQYSICFRFLRNTSYATEYSYLYVLSAPSRWNLTCAEHCGIRWIVMGLLYLPRGKTYYKTNCTRVVNHSKHSHGFSNHRYTCKSIISVYAN